MKQVSAQQFKSREFTRQKLPWKVVITPQVFQVKQLVGSFMFSEHAVKFAKKFPKSSRAEIYYEK